jgi:hypothetical protein
MVVLENKDDSKEDERRVRRLQNLPGYSINSLS